MTAGGEGKRMRCSRAKIYVVHHGAGESRSSSVRFVTYYRATFETHRTRVTDTHASRRATKKQILNDTATVSDDDPTMTTTAVAVAVAAVAAVPGAVTTITTTNAVSTPQQTRRKLPSIPTG